MNLSENEIVSKLSEVYRNNRQVISDRTKDLDEIKVKLDDDSITVREFNQLTREQLQIERTITARQFTNDGIYVAREIVMNYLIDTERIEGNKFE